MKPAITVAIVVRNRPKDIEECLTSLSKQDTPLEALLVVDNDSTDDTVDVVQGFSRRLPLRVVREPAVGYPFVYNRALRETTTEWLAIIDSDCVADPRWYGEAVKAAQRHPQCAALFGFSYNYHSRNVCACAFQFSNEWWRWRAVEDREILDYRVLDNRNIVYNASLLRQNGIRFDDSLVQGGEDVDLGLQIQAKGLPAKAVPEMIVHHKEPRSLRAFFSKKFSYTNDRALSRKWGPLAPPARKARGGAPFRRLFDSVCADLSPSQKLQCSLLVALDILLTKRQGYSVLSKLRGERPPGA